MTQNQIMMVFAIFAMACLFAGASCNDQASVRRMEQETQEANAGIEANIQRLQQAQRRLSQNPKDKDALSVILTLLKDTNGINRSNAAAVLGEVGAENGAAVKEAAVPALIDMVQHGTGADPQVALKALREFGPNATDAIPILRASLKSPDMQATWIAAEALGRMKGAAHEAVPDLVRVVNVNHDQCHDNELNVCRFAIQALGSIGPAAKGAIPDLLPLLSDKNPFLAVYTASALIRIDPNNVQALRAIGTLLKDKNVDVRRATIWTLKENGKEAKPARKMIKDSLSDGDEDVRIAASQLLRVLDAP